MKKLTMILAVAVFIMGTVCYAAETVSDVAVVASSGSAKVIPYGSEKPVECRAGMRLQAGSKIITAKDAAVDIAFDTKAKNVIKVRSGSEVIVLLDGENRIELVDGEIFAMLKNLKKGEAFKVKTPSATCGARGTGWQTRADEKSTDVSVAAGNVFVRGVKKDGTPMERSYLVKKGFERRIERFKAPGKMARISEARFEKMRKEYDRPVAALKDPEKDTKAGTPKSPELSGTERPILEGTKETSVLRDTRETSVLRDTKERSVLRHTKERSVLRDTRERAASMDRNIDRFERKPMIRRTEDSDRRSISPDRKIESTRDVKDGKRLEAIRERIDGAASGEEGGQDPPS